MSEGVKFPRRGWTVARRTVQTFALVLFALPGLIAGWGVFGLVAQGEAAAATPAELPFFGTLSSSTIGGFVLADPFAVLQVLASSKVMLPLSALVGALVVAAVYALVHARGFCGWVCPVNFVLEGTDFLRGKLGVKVREKPLPRRIKVGVAAAVLVLSAVLAVPVFELVSPIGAVNKGIVYGSLAGIVTLVLVVAAEFFIARRVWCRSLCPLGGFYEALGRVSQVNVAVDHDACIQCGICKQVCFADSAILDPAISGEDAIVRAGDCTACARCIDACPTKALSFKLGRLPKKSA